MADVHNDLLDEEDFDTILSQDIDFSGVLKFEKPFLIRGRMSGEIVAHDLLVIDEEAVVDANIIAPRVVVWGTVKGNITSSGKVEISVTGKLTGNISAPEVHLEAGCHFNGRCTMTGAD